MRSHCVRVHSCAAIFAKSDTTETNLRRTLNFIRSFELIGH